MPSTISDYEDKVHVVEKGSSTVSNSAPAPTLGSNRLHFVPRGEPLPEYDGVSDEQIVGYDSTLLRDRTVLTSDEEKRLKSRIDWRLLPLLALMYMVKTIDAQNVCALPVRIMAVMRLGTVQSNG